MQIYNTIALYYNSDYLPTLIRPVVDLTELGFQACEEELVKYSEERRDTHLLSRTHNATPKPGYGAFLLSKAES